VIGKVATLRDLDQVRGICDTVILGKGGVGKMVVQVVED